MKKATKYPDMAKLFKAKAARRVKLANLPIAEKFEIALRLQEMARNAPGYNRKESMKRHSIAALLILVLLAQFACSQSQINRAVNIASTVPGIIATFPIGNKQKVLEVADLIITGLKTFRANPTASNYQTAMRVIEDALNSGIFNFNPLVRSVFSAVKVLLAAIVPESDAVMAGDDKINVKDVRKEDVDALKRQVDALKESSN